MRAMLSQQKWQKIVDKVLRGTPYEFVGVECSGGSKRTTLRIYIDKPGGITIEDIARVSRELSVVLDVEEPEPIAQGMYTLEVSSPGLERPLFTAAHFQAQVGQKIALKSRIVRNNRQNFKGILRQADEEKIELDCGGQLFSFGYSDIDKAKVIPNIEIGAGASRK